MPKQPWVGKNLSEELEAKDLVSTSAPLLLEPNPAAAGRGAAAPIPPFVPMVWDLTATDRKEGDKNIVLAAQNIGQMVRENPARGLLLLQSLPKDPTARAAFITTLKAALKHTGWKIAEDDVSKPVLTLFNKARLQRKTPELDPRVVKPALAEAEAQSHRVDWFSSINDREHFCVGNMQYKSEVDAEKIKEDYEAFDEAYYKKKRYQPEAADEYQIIFAGALGRALNKDTEIYQAALFIPDESIRKSTTSSVILDQVLGLGSANTTATPRLDFNRRDAAVYPGESGFTADDMWEGTDITNVWSACGFHNMTTCDNTYTFPDATLESIKVTPGQDQKPLCIFGEVIPSKMLETEQGKNYLINIVTNTLQTFKNSFPGKNATKDDLPTRIKLNIPIHKGDHFSLLGIEITIDPERFANFINGAPGASMNLSDYITHTSAGLIGSKLKQDFPDGSNEKTTIETQLNAVFKPTNQPAIQIENVTPFLQFGTHPDAPGVDCGPITAEQGIRFFNDKGLLRVETKFNGVQDFPDVSTWNDNNEWGEPGNPEDADANQKRKQYAAESFRIGLELRRRFLQQCGAGAAPDKVEATKSDRVKQGYVNPDELARIRVSGTAYKQLIAAVTKYEDKGKQVFGKLPHVNEQTLLYSRNATGDTLSADKSSKITADLMMYDLFSKGYDKVTISTSSHNEAMFREAALRAGFKPENITFGEVKAVSAPKNEQAQNFSPDLANLMRQPR